MDTAQTVAQAVQAATQQAAQAAAAAAAAAAASPVQASSTPTSAIDNLTCQWQGCGERCDTAETLYDHVCERHVGRKSTNNLNLTCQWGACRTTTVKRDHITSHIRVHVPLKPHKCDFCGKSFKRPQDLKKHVKTHADDTVLTNSPAPAGNGRNIGGPPNMGPNAQPSYYPTHDNPMGNPYPGYQHTLGSNGAAAGAYPQPGGNQYGAYGSVSYPNSSSIDIHSLDTRRRAIEALNDFLGDIKRRALSPHQYMDVGQRLGVGNALPLPVGGGYNTGYSGPATGGYSNTLSAAALLDSFNQSDGMGGGGLQGPMSHGGYSLPLSNARSKNDLQDIDRFLEQLQQTVYEASNHAAAAGVQQPGVHAQYTGDFGFNNHYQARNSGSPTNYQQAATGAAAFGGLTAATMPGMTVASSTSIETPALTPASVSSYSSSGHSPLSSNGRNSFGNLSGNALYPSLPAVTGISDLGNGYPTTTSAPASGLASGFDGLDGRRYSGGRLQRQAPGQDSEMTDAGAEDGNRTPRPNMPQSQHSKIKGNSSIDPALRGDESSDSAGTPAADDKRQEDWVENIRTIESLRRWIAERLARGDYEEDVGEGSGDGGNTVDDEKTSVDIAKLVESAMRSGEPEMKDQPGMGAEGEVKYPSLSVN